MFMKSIFAILTTLLLVSFGPQHKNIAETPSALLNQRSISRAAGDASPSIRFRNASSLKRLPVVIRDLSAALEESIFQSETFCGKNGFAIHLYDVTCNSFENSAAVRYHIGDTVYQLKLNRFNRQAIDRALATTLIHETMHCVLLDIDRRAKQGDESALSSILNLGLNRNDTSNLFNNEFFVLMNSGEEGQHELMYRLFYPRMVLLLERFAEIHNEAFFDHKDAQNLMWSGLQRTKAYAVLKDEEKQEIELAILKTKGVNPHLGESD